ncbi:MAG: glucuronate isomerase [Firmicutes bacterium]|nr:glucuronate isomerase [Bacillota bacterium]
MVIANKEELTRLVEETVAQVPITDIHTHLFTPEFGPLLLRGIDELLTYHYLVAEVFRWIEMPYEEFWRLSKKEQADLIWRVLFLEHSPVSEACRGVLTVLKAFGLDPGARDLEEYRAFFAALPVETHVERVLQLSGVARLVMTNDPFAPEERAVWLDEYRGDPRFCAALRLDALLNDWEGACRKLGEWGYKVASALDPAAMAEVRRFLNDWIKRMNPVYLAVSLPPDFLWPEDSARARLIAEAVLPLAAEHGLPFAMMIGVKKLVNPGLRLAGDSVGKAGIETVERLCASFPRNKFMLTMLSRENQHEGCVVARKFGNLLPFGCWWFMNNPSLVEETTRMRVELLGLSFVPQHSDARVLDQLIYKWAHSRKNIARVLSEKYADLWETGWRPTAEEIRRDVAGLFGENFWRFLGYGGKAA